MSRYSKMSPLQQRTYQVTEADLAMSFDPMHSRLEQLLLMCGGVAKVAAATGHATAKFYDWCNGTKQPTAKGLAELAIATGVDLNWLLLGRGYPFPGKRPTGRP